MSAQEAKAAVGQRLGVVAVYPANENDLNNVTVSVARWVKLAMLVAWAAVLRALLVVTAESRRTNGTTFSTLSLVWVSCGWLLDRGSAQIRQVDSRIRSASAAGRGCPFCQLPRTSVTWPNSGSE
jgi:hypothetical protein